MGTRYVDGMKRVVLFLLLMMTGLVGTFAAPQAELWDVWLPHDPASTSMVDHSDWDTLLQRYRVLDPASGVALFAYARVTLADRELLQRYLRSLEGTRVSALNRDEQYAFWVNFYNALTVEVILDHWPVASIRDINLGGGRAFSRGPWDAPLVEVEGRPVSLNDMEHRILRPIWNDPRIHYAVNCASIGCPNLQPVAFTAASLEELLERAAREYVNHPRGVEVSGNTAHLSSIYDWFSSDFGSSRQELLQHIAGYAQPELRRAVEPFLAGSGRLRYRYDWSINAAP